MAVGFFSGVEKQAATRNKNISFAWNFNINSAKSYSCIGLSAVISLPILRYKMIMNEIRLVLRQQNG